MDRLSKFSISLIATFKKLRPLELLAPTVFSLKSRIRVFKFVNFERHSPRQFNSSGKIPRKFLDIFSSRFFRFVSLDRDYPIIKIYYGLFPNRLNYKFKWRALKLFMVYSCLNKMDIFSEYAPSLFSDKFRCKCFRFFKWLNVFVKM